MRSNRMSYHWIVKMLGSNIIVRPYPLEEIGRQIMSRYAVTVSVYLMRLSPHRALIESSWCEPYWN